MIYCVKHELGHSLVEAKRREQALSFARREFGNQAAPFRIGTDEDVAWAQAMGARVMHAEDTQ